MIELEPAEEKQLPMKIREIRSFVSNVILTDKELKLKFENTIEGDENGTCRR